MALQLVSEHMHTIYSKSSYSTSSIDPLHLCNNEPILDSVGRHTVQYAAYLIYLWKTLALGWSESICTLYKSSYSTSSIDPLHLCNSEPILHSIGIHILYSISIITLQGLYPLAGPRAYAHYIRPHKAHPSFTNGISAKIQPSQLLSRHTYIQYAAYYSYHAKLWAFGWSESICTLHKSS